MSRELHLPRVLLTLGIKDGDDIFPLSRRQVKRPGTASRWDKTGHIKPSNAPGETAINHQRQFRIIEPVDGTTGMDPQAGSQPQFDSPR
jgi:hypothetical protein